MPDPIIPPPPEVTLQAIADALSQIWQEPDAKPWGALWAARKALEAAGYVVKETADDE
jgi:hypothetical protein